MDFFVFKRTCKDGIRSIENDFRNPCIHLYKDGLATHTYWFVSKTTEYHDLSIHDYDDVQLDYEEYYEDSYYDIL